MADTKRIKANEALVNWLSTSEESILIEHVFGFLRLREVIRFLTETSKSFELQTILSQERFWNVQLQQRFDQDALKIVQNNFVLPHGAGAQFRYLWTHPFRSKSPRYRSNHPDRCKKVRFYLRRLRAPTINFRRGFGLHKAISVHFFKLVYMRGEEFVMCYLDRNFSGRWRVKMWSEDFFGVDEESCLLLCKDQSVYIELAFRGKAYICKLHMGRDGKCIISLLTRVNGVITEERDRYSKALSRALVRFYLDKDDIFTNPEGYVKLRETTEPWE